MTRDEELLDIQPKFASSPPSTLPDIPPLIEPSIEKILSDIRVGEQSNPTEIDFIKNGKRKMINDCDHKCPKAVGFSYPGVVLHCSEGKKKRITLENVNDNSPKKQKEKRKRSKGIARNASKKTKTENKRPSGIFVGYAKLPSEFKETTKEKRSMM